MKEASNVRGTDSKTKHFLVNFTELQKCSNKITGIVSPMKGEKFGNTKRGHKIPDIHRK